MRACWGALAIAAALAGGAPGRSRAALLFELPPADPTLAGTLFSDAQVPREAATFFTIPQNAQLTNVVWWGGYLDEIANPGSSPFEIRFFADTASGPADAPFAAVAVTASVSPFPAPIPEFEYASSLTEPVALDAGSYWISIVDVDPTLPTFEWRKSTQQSFSYSRTPGEAWSLTDGLGSVRIEGEPVPEPGAGALTAFALVGLALVRAVPSRASRR